VEVLGENHRPVASHLKMIHKIRDHKRKFYFRLYYIFSSGDMLLLEEGDIPILWAHSFIFIKEFID